MPRRIGYHVHVAAGYEEIARARFNKARGRPKILNLPRVRRSGNEDGVFAWCRRAMDVGQQFDAVAHRDRDVVIVCHLKFGP